MPCAPRSCAPPPTPPPPLRACPAGTTADAAASPRQAGRCTPRPSPLAPLVRSPAQPFVRPPPPAAQAGMTEVGAWSSPAAPGGDFDAQVKKVRPQGKAAACQCPS